VLPLAPVHTAGLSAYVGITIAAALEGEITFVGAAALVSLGMLDPVAVIAAGAMGAALGDQFYFYAFRGSFGGLKTGPLARWLGRKPAVAAKSTQLIDLVRRHDTAMVLAIRFAPGLRIALAAACAYAGVRALKVSVLNGIASVVWAVLMLWLVAYVGPAMLERGGISGWWGPLVPAAAILLAATLLIRGGRKFLRP
jgi:membrane protein DedA with SNARE-associated domain